MAVGGLLLKGTSVFLRALQFIASIAVVGIFGYFLWYLRNQDIPTFQWVRAVTGLAGASALYTLIALFLVCCLGGKMVFAFLGIALDVAFIGCWIAVTYLTRRGGTNSCGVYDDSQSTRITVAAGSRSSLGFDGASLDVDEARRICQLQKATFGIAIAQIILFVLSAIFSLFLGKHHQKEKRNAVPNTPHSVGQRRRFWQKKRHPADAEVGRPSHDTAMTGNTAVNDGHTAYGAYPKYGQATNY